MTADSVAALCAALGGRELVKGHGTANDFLLVADPDGALDLAPGVVAALCDRRTGIGADGLIRVVRTAALDGQGVPGAGGAAATDEAPQWFMDYRNADGSVAEMCGNGVRVFVHYLRVAGLVDLPDGATLAVGTRAGVREVTRRGELYAVGMGRWSLPGGAAATADGYDAVVAVAGLEGPRAGLSVDVGNPHTVVALPDEDELDAADLGRAPAVDPVPPHGTNVELVVPLGEEEVAGVLVGTVRMRVYERGVGETASCGTGCCAAALAVRAWGGAGAPDVWRVLVPGGELGVRVIGESVELTGPAEFVATVRPGVVPGPQQ